MQAPIHIHTPGWVSQFKSFILRGNVVDLAVGIIIGAAFTSIVNSLVKDIFTPLIGLIVGGIDFTNIFVTLRGPSQPTLDAAQKAGAVTLNVGAVPERGDPVPHRGVRDLLGGEGAQPPAAQGRVRPAPPASPRRCWPRSATHCWRRVTPRCRSERRASLRPRSPPAAAFGLDRLGRHVGAGERLADAAGQHEVQLPVAHLLVAPHQPDQPGGGEAAVQHAELGRQADRRHDGLRPLGHCRVAVAEAADRRNARPRPTATASPCSTAP